MRLAEYLGRPVGGLLATPPFSGWEVSKTIEEDLPKKEIWYEFKGRGVEVICDEFERIRTIFLHRGDGEALSDISFALSRRAVLEHYRFPPKSGAPALIPGLGKSAAWDRFDFPAASIHVQYKNDRDEIDMITLIRPDAVP